MPPVDLSTKTDVELEQWIANHESKQDGVNRPLYRQLLEERARRAQTKQKLNFDRSLEHLRQAAIGQVCTSYSDLAKASGVEWATARRQMSGSRGHLERLLDLCHARGLPLLTALCVYKDSVTECELGEDALKGCVAGAKRLGVSVNDGRAFHHQCRDECWQWGREQTGRTGGDHLAPLAPPVSRS